MNISIEALKQMTIGQIKELENSINKIGDIVDQKKEFLHYLNENEN